MSSNLISVRSRGEEWYAYYGLEEDRDSPLVQKLLEFETKLISWPRQTRSTRQCVGTSSSRPFRIRVGSGIPKLSREARYCRRTVTFGFTRRRGCGADAHCASRGCGNRRKAALLREHGKWACAVGRSIRQTAALDRAMSEATLAFANFSLSVFTNGPAFQGGIDTDFGKMSLKRNLRSSKETVRDRLR